MQTTKHRRANPWMIAWAASTLLFAGCNISSGSKVAPPNVDPRAAAAEAIRIYDADGDGRLSESELAACPGIKQRRDQYDQDRDEQISQDEIAARVEQLFPSSVGLLTVDCRVTRQGRPLSGATVTFTPEPFLGNLVQTAIGTTDSNGTVSPSIPADELPTNLQRGKFMHSGIYRVEIEHPSVSSKNGKPLGAEIDPMIRDGSTVQFNL